MLMTEKKPDHFLIGQPVHVNGEEGEIKNVIEHTYEVHGIRKTQKRVIVDVGDREINAGTDDVEVMR